MAKEKDLIKKFSEDKKAVSKVNNYLGSAYLLMSMAMHDVDVACEELKKIRFGVPRPKVSTQQS